MSIQPITVAVNGAAGRMGQRIVALVHDDPALQLQAALEGADHPKLGADAGDVAGIGSVGVSIATELVDRVDVVIDFSVPEGLAQIADIFGERQAAAQEAPVIVAPSMSLAVNLAMSLVRKAAAALKSHADGVDVEIIERHHRFKEDAPSGTALRSGEIIASEIGQTSHVHGRSGRPGQRPPNEIGYHALRTGDNVGEHKIVFGMFGETLEIDVRSTTRDAYARGALAAAKFLVTKRPGLYTMDDVLGLARQ